ncbi:MAG: PAS domain-containing protein, partial [Caldimonas sp.]
MRLLFEQAPGFIAVLEGPSHVFALVNPAYQRLVGSRDLIGKSVSVAIPEARAYGFLEILDEVYASGETFVGRRSAIELIRSAGTPAEKRFVDFLYQPLLDSANSVAGIFVEGHDVTEEVEAESMLREEVAQRATQARIFDTVLSSIDDYAYTFDRNGRFTYSNKPLLDLLGLALDEVVGKTFPELPYPPELAARLHADIAQVIETGLQVKGETYYMSPTGKEGWYEYIFNPVMADGSVSTVAGSTRNLTQHREQERRLAALNDSERAARAESERASRLKDDFLATLSHELRTPLNSIQAWAHLLRSGRLTAEQSRDAVERIARNAHAQGQLIADLLDMNSIVSGKIALKIERVPLARPLQGAIDAVSLEAARKNVAVQVPGLDPALVVDCDPDRLQQVFWNLLANAVKFTPSEGTITIRAERNATSVRIDVSDTGIGIANDFLPHLFERFSQADSSATRTHGGLGLGLSICKSLVEMH